MAVRMPALDVGKLHANLGEIIARHGDAPSVEPLVMTDDVHAFVICHPPGQPNDAHYHQHDEWRAVVGSCRSKPWRLEPGETPATAAPHVD